MTEPEDEDNFPNDYDGLDFDNIPELQAPTIRTPDVSVPSTAPRNFVPTTASSPVPSNGSNNSEDMDSSFLAEVDALEARALNEMSQGGHRALSSEVIDEQLDLKGTLKAALDSPQGAHPWRIARIHGAICDHFHGTHAFEIEGTRSLHHAYEHSMQSPEASAANKKGKRKAEPQEDVDLRSILAGYETELTCPINANPPAPYVGRALFVQKPLLPNFSVDNFVRQHIQALATSGCPEWQKKGYRNVEWNKRLESWKKQAAVRAEKEKSKMTSHLRWCQPHYYQVDQSYAAPWMVDEGMDDDEGAIFARVLPRRGTRSRR
ncbi:hypothetical protein J3R82DRAFT_1038 [Butyriboletus roseoflavus]|nr:hypothetical protein J3R82DRAFT_1038 [Butyriboletus roseoflavus]